MPDDRPRSARGGPLGLAPPAPRVIRIGRPAGPGGGGGRDGQEGARTKGNEVLQEYVDEAAEAALAAASTKSKGCGETALSPPPPSKMRRKRRRRGRGSAPFSSSSSSVPCKPPSTFGVGPRMSFHPSPFKDADLHIDLTKWKSIEANVCTNRVRPCASFRSSSPRFEDPAASTPGPDGNTILERKIRSVCEKMQRQVLQLTETAVTTPSTAAVGRDKATMRAALQQGINALGETMLTIERIDSANASNVRSGLHDANAAAAKKSDNATDGGQISQGVKAKRKVRPHCRRCTQMPKKFTTFGVGIQRDDSLYRRIVPQSRGESCASYRSTSSFRVRHPERPSSCFSSRSPRACNPVKFTGAGAFTSAQVSFRRSRYPIVQNE